ncbi:hypothetical protein FGB62_62g138 [Gracilaria domingensis]|nr:hypothetical protein FGB62_62g138 [Gracilaria domingensis]
MAGGVVRVAANQVSATKEILMGAVIAISTPVLLSIHVLRIQGGFVWRAWHLSYKASVDDYYKKLAADEAAAAASSSS